MSGSRKRRYAFVAPRYFTGIAGGAETLISSLAERVAARGDQVELLVTCARDNRSWENHFPPGSESLGPLTLRRFPVDPRDLEVWIPRQIQISDGMHIGLDQELSWMAESVNSAALYRYLAEQRGRFDLVFFGPYLFGTTFWGSLIDPLRAVLIPCLHDECFAYTEVIGSMFRQVRGALFNAAGEADLARSLYGAVAGGEVGMGFDPPAPEVVAGLAPYFEDRFPYLLYVGRKETMKQLPELIDLFTQAKDSGLISSSLRLVVAGGGSFSDLHRPSALERGDIVDVDHLAEQDKQRLIHHALALVQPSTNESFSIVLMEAWMLGVPVLVNARCAVTREHVVRSGGGLFFGDLEDFCGVVNALADDEGLRKAMAEAGDRYVREVYNWEAVIKRFDTVCAALLEPEPARAAGVDPAR